MTPRKPPKARRRRSTVGDQGQWISVAAPWFAMDLDDEAIARARYLAVRDLVDGPPVFLAGERRADWHARMGDMRWFPHEHAARFDPDLDVRQSIILEALEADRRAVVGEHDDRSWRRWDVSVIHSVLDPRVRLTAEYGKGYPADVILEALDRLRRWGAIFSISVTAFGTEIVGEMPDDGPALELARAESALVDSETLAEQSRGGEFGAIYARSVAASRATRDALRKQINTPRTMPIGGPHDDG